MTLKNYIEKLAEPSVEPSNSPKIAWNNHCCLSICEIKQNTEQKILGKNGTSVSEVFQI